MQSVNTGSKKNAKENNDGKASSLSGAAGKTNLEKLWNKATKKLWNKTEFSVSAKLLESTELSDKAYTIICNWKSLRLKLAFDKWHECTHGTLGVAATSPSVTAPAQKKTLTASTDSGTDSTDTITTTTTTSNKTEMSSDTSDTTSQSHEQLQTPPKRSRKKQPRKTLKSLRIISPADAASPQSKGNRSHGPPARPPKLQVSPSTQRKRKRVLPRGRTGLRNLGNSCYFNAVVQVLSHISTFRDFFNSLAFKQYQGASPAPPPDPAPASRVETIDTTTPGPPPIPNFLNLMRQDTTACFQQIKSRENKKLPIEKVSLSIEVQRLLRVLWSGRWACATPHALFFAVWRFLPRFRSYEQQDAQEFYNCLVDRLQTELAYDVDDVIQEPPTAQRYTPSGFPLSPKSLVFACTPMGREDHSDLESTPGNPPPKKSLPGGGGGGGDDTFDVVVDGQHSFSPMPPPARQRRGFSKSLSKVPRADFLLHCLGGKLCYRTRCHRCQSVSSRSENFWCLPLDIPTPDPKKKPRRASTRGKGAATRGKGTATRGKGTTTRGYRSARQRKLNKNSTASEGVTLQDCLSKLTAQETLTGSCSYHCDICADKTTATRQVALQRAPDALWMHVNRTRWTKSGTRVKVRDHVAFPQTLDLSAFAWDRVGGQVRSANTDVPNTPTSKHRTWTYRLGAIINHHGRGINMGHYTSYCRDSNGVWLLFNDIKTSVVSEQEVGESQAFMLMYRRELVAA